MFIARLYYFEMLLSLLHILLGKCLTFFAKSLVGTVLSAPWAQGCFNKKKKKEKSILASRNVCIHEGK